MQYPIYQTRTENVLTVSPRGLRDTLNYLADPATPGCRVGEAHFRSEPSDLRRFGCVSGDDATGVGAEDGDAGLTVEKALDRLSVTDAPMTRENAAVAIKFLTKHCGHSEEKIISYMRAMDLSKEVKTIQIPEGRFLAGFKDPDNASRPHPLHGEFFTKAGTSPTSLGIEVDRQHYVKYQVNAKTKALLSTASAFAHEKRGSGGGEQFIIPFSVAIANLTVVHVSAERTRAGRTPPSGSFGTNRR